MPRGKFITFEGGEGGGKSTQVKLLAEALRAAGQSVVTTREPGGSPSAEQIRNLLVSGDVDRWQPFTEALLNYAARTEHLAHTVEPALEQGSWVISDRFSDSTLAYQGYGHGLERSRIEELHRLTVGNFMPDLTCILDLPVETGLKRALGRGDGEDRYERMDKEFHNRLRAGFLEIASRDVARCIVIDATATIENIHGRILEALADRFPELSL